MYCRRCGAQLSDREEFCANCGAPTGQQSGGYSNHRKKNNNSVIIGIIAALAVVAVAAILCCAVVTKSRQEKELAQIQAQTEQAQAKAEVDKAEAELAKAEAEAEAAKAKAESEAQKTKREKEKKKEVSTVNNYYYYGTDHASGDYYSSVGNSGYLWPTDSEYITSSDLSSYDRDTVDAIRNEIYARHGYAFSKQRWKDYFGAKSWYYRNENINADTIDGHLTSIERANIDTIVKYEKSMGWI